MEDGDSTLTAKWMIKIAMTYQVQAAVARVLVMVGMMGLVLKVPIHISQIVGNSPTL